LLFIFKRLVADHGRLVRLPRGNLHVHHSLLPILVDVCQPIDVVLAVEALLDESIAITPAL